jgi:hypothetical protein
MWKKANNNAIRTKIRELTTNIIEMVRKGTTVNELWTIFKETLCTIITQMFQRSSAGADTPMDEHHT